MPSQYPSETRVTTRRAGGGRMVSGTHVVPNGKASVEAVASQCVGKEGGKERRMRKNGVISHPVLLSEGAAKSPTSRAAPAHGEERKTRGQPTKDVSTEREREGEVGRDLCPQAALSYTSTILSKRAGRTGSRQRQLDSRLSILRSQMRSRQGREVCRHVRKQLKVARGRRERSEEGGVSSEECGGEGRGGGIPMQVDGAIEESPVPLPCHVRAHESLEQPLEQMETDLDSLPAASDKLNLSDQSSRSDQSEECSVVQVVERWRQQLCTVCEDAGGEVTESSSDEEGVEERRGRRRRRLDSMTQKWERSRAQIGDQWAWLRHRITDLNKQVSQLDNVMQSRPSREQFAIASPSQCVWSVSRPAMSQLCQGGVGGGGGRGGGEKGKVVNGVAHPTPVPPHLLISDGILGSRIQVKDLLTPSSLSNNVSFILEDGGYSAARTRPLQKRVKRKIVRQKQKQRRHQDLYHKLLPHDIPSWVWLDEALQRVLREHSYASIPQPKRFHRGPVRTGTLSPSPDGCDGNTSVRSVSRRPLPLADIGPSSPSLSRASTPIPLTPSLLPLTPSLPPLTPSLPRKKRPTTQTPAYDIDNIVIPYSMAAATRLEKLEYKEIVTPQWREVGSAATTAEENEASAEDDGSEDTSEEVITARHEKYEQLEKKRFLNFISGGQRRRARPSSLSSTPDTPHSPWPTAKVRRTTLPSSPVDSSPLPAIPPWPRRTFPLEGPELEALTNPPPPPPQIPAHLSSLSPLLARPLTPAEGTFPRTPSSNSAVATPLSSPSTPFGESPISPTGWAVNSQIMPPKTSSFATGNIVLRLTKKT